MSKIKSQKRQKEMKRMEKQRAKAERRARKKLENRTANLAPDDNLSANSPTEVLFE
jgi:hypothetical protein